MTQAKIPEPKNIEFDVESRDFGHATAFSVCVKVNNYSWSKGLLEPGLKKTTESINQERYSELCRLFWRHIGAM